MRGAPRALAALAALGFGLGLGLGAGAAHDGPHAAPDAGAGPGAGRGAGTQALAGPAGEGDPAAFPATIGGPFALTDQHGARRTEVEPAGRPQLVFFGYASCPGICSHVLPTLAALTDALAAEGLAATPVLITVDPAQDTPQALAAAAPAIHPALVALTGSGADLAAARAAFGVESALLFESPEHGPIYAHGSYIYLLDGRGRFLTLLPPILSVERMVEIVAGYVGS